MNFLKSNYVRRLPLALAAVAALGIAMTQALATPAGKVGEPCTINSGPLKGWPGIYKFELGNAHKVICAPTSTRFLR